MAASSDKHESEIGSVIQFPFGDLLSENIMAENNDPAEHEDEGICAEDSEGESQPPTMSKNQMKKQKRREKWLLNKGPKRKAEKLRRKEKLKLAKERGDDLGPSRKRLKEQTMENSACKVKVVIDCSFDEYMTEKDVMQLGQQIQYSYSSNRRAKNPVQFHVTSLGGKTLDRLSSIGDYKGWDVKFHKEDFTEVFEKDSIVYLSSDSDNILEKLDEDKAYIIGGLVDHNKHKGLCHKLAEEKGIQHAQLPIGEFIHLKTRKVLTVNHVFEILLRFTETQNWEEAFMKVIPKRKGVESKNDNELVETKHEHQTQSEIKGLSLDENDAIQHSGSNKNEVNKLEKDTH